MSRIIVRGGRQLSGRVKISGAKNAVLPIIAGTLLAEQGHSVIYEAPPLKDVVTICDVLRALGATVRCDEETLQINTETIHSRDAPIELVRQMRASFLVMGPLLARFGKARIPLPGGCAIGTRPVDQHLKGFEAMGAEITLGKGYIEARTSGRLQGSKIYLDVASVGATENIMMAATLAEGTTVIENAAKEPEITDLANFLNAMGARIRGAGTGLVRIDGVTSLQGREHTVIPDRIEAGTYMAAAAITGGNVLVEGAIEDHLKPVISKMQEMGISVTEEEEGIRVTSDGLLKAVDVKTLPYPGFPTDMQSQMMALLLVSEGAGLVTETVFENRFMHVEEFVKMRADIKVEGRTALVNGGNRLAGARVCATDLRAGAALILAGLTAEGVTEISNIHHVDRGYIHIVEKLSALGAEIYRAVREEANESAEPSELAEPQGSMLQIQPSWA